MIQLFSAEEEAAIVKAIQAAEAQTSGEVRVHIEKNCRGDIMKAAIRTFRKLGMHRTANRNGVLIFIAPERRELAIVGDAGIHAVAPPGFWDAERDLMIEGFRQGQAAQGICTAIAAVGEKLKAHFPVQPNDADELPNEVSYSD